MSDLASENIDSVWESALKKIKDKIPASSFQAWVKPAKLVLLENDRAVIHVRNEFNRNLLVQNYYKSLLESLQETTGRNYLDLVIEINPDLPSESYVPAFSSISSISSISDTKKETGSTNSIISGLGVITKKKVGLDLNPKFVFETFVVGAHNQFCHAAALAIAENPAKGPYNPFFIYGGVGLGKTHIMQAIGNYVLQKNPSARVLYITTEKFLNDLIESVRQGNMNEFRSRYRQTDLLLIDDIQFIEGKESTQQEFFHTFNALRDQGSQIIMTSDRPPQGIPKLEPRLCSRFEGGLVADVQSPTLETRLAILERKAEEMNLRLPDCVEMRIAESFSENIRTLEGALAKLKAYVEFTAAELTSEVVERILQLKPVTPRTEPTGKLIDKIIDEVSSLTNLSRLEIIGAAKNKNLVQARQICVYVARKQGISWSEIGQGLGGRGNSSLINLHRNISDDLSSGTFELLSVLNKTKELFQSADLQSLEAS